MKMTPAQQAWQRNIDVVVALIGIAVGIGISSFNLIYSNNYLITMGPMLAIVCLVYLFLRRRLLSDSAEPPGSSRTLFLAISVLFWVSLAGSIYSLNLYALHRPLIFFLLTSLSAAMIALQILNCRGKATVYLVIFEILLLSLTIRASAFWVFPTIPGVDSWEHMTIVKSYVTQGRIVQLFQYAGIEEHLNYYFSMPMMHVNTAITQIMTGVDFKTAMFLGTSLPLLMSTVFVFLVGQSLVNTKVGMLAMLLVSLSDYHILWSAGNIIAMSFGIALFTIILYLLTVHGSQFKVSGKILTILLLAALIFTHTVSYFIMAVFLAMAAIGSNVHRFLYPHRSQLEREVVTTPTLAQLFVVAMLGHAMYVYVTSEGTSFFQFMVRSYYGSITATAEFIVTKVSPVISEQGWLGPILNISGYLLLLLFGVIGCLLWLSWKHHSNIKTSLISALIVMIGLSLSFPLFRIAEIEWARWTVFYYVIVSIPAAMSIVTITNCVKYQTLRNIVLSCLIFGFSFFMITNSVANMDSPVYAPHLNERLAYTEAEVAVREIAGVYDGQIITDGRYRAVLVEMLNREPGSVSSDMLSEREPDGNYLIIWREVLNERPAQITARFNKYQLAFLGESYEQKLENSHNLVYSNKDIKIFLAKNQP